MVFVGPDFHRFLIELKKRDYAYLAEDDRACVCVCVCVEITWDVLLWIPVLMLVRFFAARF